MTSSMPKAVYFIIVVELMERFSFYGIRPLLFNYFRFIGSDDVKAKEYTHMFSMICYFFPLIGAAISDSFLGKYRTILYLAIVYALGLVGLAVTSMPAFQSLYTISASLLLVAVGTGGIKPCVSSFGGDLFKAEDAHLMRQFFSYFYVSINIGAVMSGFITPLLKDEITCFGGPCYFLGFLVPAILFVFAIICFVAGYKYYVFVPPLGEFLPLKAILLIFSAIKNSITNKQTTKVINKKVDFLDNASPEYDYDFVEEVRAFIRMFVVILPLLFTWMVYEQNATAWQEQYSRMDGTWFGVNITDEMFVAVFNPLLVIIMVYILATWVYPLFEKKGVPFGPLKRICIGAILVTLSFFLSSFLEIYVDSGFNGTVDPKTQRYICAPGKCLHAAYQLPQWILLNLGESFFSPTGSFNLFRKRICLPVCWKENEINKQ
eukprot:NODE_36_length_36011_cov_1.012920.p8 type:complete len:433 gc:universal NODE_36_length_36011_cov_1.012920:15256-13958(-)